MKILWKFRIRHAKTLPVIHVKSRGVPRFMPTRENEHAISKPEKQYCIDPWDREKRYLRSHNLHTSVIEISFVAT
mgnify:CR=1 FL=1